MNIRHSLTPGGRALDAYKADAARVAYRAIVKKNLTNPGSFYKKVADVAETDSDVSTTLWLSRAPRMREWTSGPKLLKKFRVGSDTIRTKPHEASVLVAAADIDNDKFGMYAGKIAGLGKSYPEALDLLVARVLNNAFNSTMGTSYDGANLIDDEHQAIVGGALQSNIVTGAFGAAAYATAFERFGAFVDEEGVPMPRKPAWLMVGYALRQTARALIEAPYQAGGATNIEAGTVNLIVSPYITGTNWFLLVEDPSAIVLHIKKPPIFLSVDGLNNDFRFSTGNYKYGIEAEFGAKPGMWEDVVGGPGV